MMRADVLQYIYNQQDLKQFIREQPLWYRKLTRNPFEINKLEVHAMNHYEKTIPHKVQRFSSGAQMASMLLGMFQAMNTK